MSTSETPAAPVIASRGKIIMMAIIAGAVITNLYCVQPILPLIASSLGVDQTTVDLVAGAALLGFAFGLALLLPLGDRFDRRKLVLGQIAVAFIFRYCRRCSAEHLDADRRGVRTGCGQLCPTTTGAFRCGDVATQ